jgi:hypothetical protein
VTSQGQGGPNFVNNAVSQYQLDSFPEENHNPFSDHNDFANVNSDQTMACIAECVNAGRRCS